MKIDKVWFDNDYIFLRTDVGHIIGNRLSCFIILLNATKGERNNFKFGHFGIYWPGLNEDLGMNGFFNYKSKVTLH